MVEKKRLNHLKNKDFSNLIALGIKIPPFPESLTPIEKPRLEIMPLLDNYAWPRSRNELQELATNLYQGLDADLHVGQPTKKNLGDLTIPCHPLSKFLHQSPKVIAESIANELDQTALPKSFKKATAVDGYLNFDLDINSFGTQILRQIEELGDRYGEHNIGNGNTVVIDCSSPNIAKYMSVGHLRSTVIGESLARIYQKLGYTVIRDNHIGDWGTQFGMLGRAYELWKDEIPELRDNSNPVQGLYKLYVKMHQQIEVEKKADPQGESSLEREGKKWFQRLENRDLEAIALWKWALELSLKEFQQVYGLLRVRFEYILGESYYIDMLPSVIQSLVQNQVATKNQDGSVTVEFDDKNLGKLVIQKSDGTSLYATRDLAALAARTAWFKPEKIIYVVGEEQQFYFKQVFAAFNKLTESKGPELEHAWFGLLSLPEGKMSTRRGNVIFLADVLEESIKRVKQIIENRKDGRFTEEEVEKIAKQVGIGAVIYFDLSQTRLRNIKFDWDQALSFDGNSAPYIQYAHTRAKSILRKAEELGLQIDQTGEISFELSIEQDLVKHLSRFPVIIQQAMYENKPSIIAEYTYTTADLFNQFYKQTEQTPIIKDIDPQRKKTRLRLTAASAQVIKNGLYLLGIEAPERM